MFHQLNTMAPRVAQRRPMLRAGERASHDPHRVRAGRLALLTAVALYTGFACSAPASAQQIIEHEYFTYDPLGEAPADSELPSLPRPGERSESDESDDDSPNGGGEFDEGENPITQTPEGPEYPDSMEEQASRNGPLSNAESVSLDRDTDREGVLQYVAVFNPTVAPWKRVGARDAVVQVGGEYHLVTADRTLTPRAASPGRRGGEELFLGKLTVNAAPGAWIPVPSVAPSMRLVHANTDPPARTDFSADSADNFFVQIDHEGQVELEFLVAAPTTWFGGDWPNGRARGITRAPDDLIRDAARVTAAAGVTPLDTDADVVRKLAVWFRGFEARPFPEDEATDNLYLDIALGRIGVCRHRSLTYVMTALAAGIPSRYVYNEAHAFVESWIAGYGWRRIDLGGAAEGLEIFASPDTQLHEAPPEQGLPPVPGYDESYSASPEDARRGDFSELSDRSSAAAPEPTQEAPPTGGQSFGELPEAGRAGAEDPRSGALSTRVVFDPLPDRAYRGAQIPVSGRVIGDGPVPVPDAEVTIVIGPADVGDASAWVDSVGTATTDNTGRFEATITLPGTISPGTWGIYAVFYGNDVFGASRSE